ncbi:MAG: AAA family ATPase, partial [Bacteroidales bacterium]
SSIVLFGNDKVTIGENETKVERRIGVKRDEHYKEELNAAFITPRSNERSYVKTLNDLLEDKKKADLIEALKKLDPTIEDIMVKEEELLCDVGFDKFLPINMMGDGVRKFMHIITALYSVRGGVLFVDEIDNGLHYTSTCILWKLIYDIAEDLDVQVFATTHSLDTLLSLKSIMENEDSSAASKISCIKLKQLKDGVLKAYVYDRDSFTHLLNQEVEIR